MKVSEKIQKMSARIPDSQRDLQLNEWRRSYEEDDNGALLKMQGQ